MSRRFLNALRSQAWLTDTTVDFFTLSDQGVRTNQEGNQTPHHVWLWSNGNVQEGLNESGFKIQEKDGVREVSAIPAALLAPPSS